jgi:hypothetical protein
MSADPATLRKLRIAGWVVVGLSVLPFLFAILQVILLLEPGTRVAGPHYTPGGHYLRDDRPQQEMWALSAALELSLGALLTAMGLGLTRRENWARVATSLITFVCLVLVVAATAWYALWYARVTTAVAGPIGIAIFAVFGGQMWCLIRFLRWLCSPAVRAACSRPVPLPPAPPPP